MLSCSRLEDVARRFEPFVADLRSFLKQTNVAYGFPEHLLAFTEKLSSDPLRAGVSSKLLEVIHGSQQAVSHGELVELLLVTIGGANIDEDTPAVQKAERVLSQLVGEVMTSREALSPFEHPTPETPSELHSEILPSAFAFETAEPELPIQPLPSRPEAIAWAAPPGYLWAALLCGLLLPPCMYFLSRPHEAPRSAPSATTTSSVPSAVREVPAPNPVPPFLLQLKPLDLDFVDAPAPKKRSHKAVTQPATTPAPNTLRTEDLSSAPDAKAPILTDRQKPGREADMSARDVGGPASTPPEAVKIPRP